jgi:hypothetical protein
LTDVKVAHARLIYASVMIQKQSSNTATSSIIPTPTLRTQFWLALGVFLLAGSTGAWLRFGVTAGFPLGLQYTNIRHAHSHLMYFGWVTPALMVLILINLERLAPQPLPHAFQHIIHYTFGAALLAYAAFLPNGYRPTVIGGLALPLSVMAAGLNVVGWYAFIWQYIKFTKGAPRTLTLRLWDAALTFMGLASLGGWGLPLLTLLQLEDPLISMALTHLFLDIFADGWFVLAMLGIIYTTVPTAANEPRARRSHELMIVGLPALFLLGIPTHVVSGPLRLIGSIGGLLVSLGLLGHLSVLWRRVAASWRLPLFFLGLKAVTLLIIVIPAVAAWAERSGLRVPYLHWLLLGFVTLGLVTAALAEEPQSVARYQRWFVAAVVALQVTLLPLTQLWPVAWRGRWVLTAAAWGALAPVLVGLLMLTAVVITHRYTVSAQTPIARHS